MLYGFAGKILHVDLTAQTLAVEEPSEAFYRKYMGGSAAGLYYILRDMPAGADPLSPENILTLMVSAPTGAPVSGQSRINANARSPMGGAIGDSQGGGFFPAELKFAGFDGIVITGRAPHPVYLSIRDGEAALHDASHLWGKVTGEVDTLLKNEFGDGKAQVLQCGPAGEVGVRFASLVSMATRNNGRTGMGLVMGSKNLKAVVVRGTHPIKVANPQALSAIARSAPKKVSDNQDTDRLGKFGTADGVAGQNMSGTLPTRNYSEGQFELFDNITGERMAETYLQGRDTCYACVIRCKRVVSIESGPYPVDPVYGGPEYETIGTLGSYCGIGDLAAICKANEICNQHGVDTIAAGATLAFAMDCFEKGVIGLEQTGGLTLRFGDPDIMLVALMQMVTNQGKLGKVLSQGSEIAAQIWGNGAEKLLTTVKGSEAPAHMPQAKKSLALIYAVNPFGADHQSSEHDFFYEEGALPNNLVHLSEIGLTQPPEPGSFGHEKVRFATLTQWFYSMLDTLELCQFVYSPSWTIFGPNDTVELVKAVTGWDVTIEELMQVGQRRLNMLRMYNAHEGFTRQDDRLPAKFFTPLTGTGPTSGVIVNPEDFEKALDDYYNLSGWSSEGIPTPEILSELGLSWIFNPDLQPN
ncbi:MAG: aldehyde ferredoxin oxidoreductase family protein [Chloroflexi bacterium]|nr:aldehyde ferredoxin oxidoreductase family protein [Chloroflexota bacterium]